MDIWSPQLWEWLARPCFLFMFLFFWRIEWYLENKLHCKALYRLIWESRLLPLKMLVSCIICFKRIWKFHALKDLHEGTLHTDVHLVFLWCVVHTAIKISFPFSPSAPPDLCAGLGTSHLSLSPPLLRPWKPWAAFKCDRTMMSFGRICQGRLMDPWQCCKKILFEAFLLIYLPPRTKCWQKANTQFKKEKCWFEDKRKGVFSLLEVRSRQLSCSHV